MFNSKMNSSARVLPWGPKVYSLSNDDPSSCRNFSAYFARWKPTLFNDYVKCMVLKMRRHQRIGIGRWAFAFTRIVTTCELTTAYMVLWHSKFKHDSFRSPPPCGQSYRVPGMLLRLPSCMKRQENGHKHCNSCWNDLRLSNPLTFHIST